MNQPLNMGGNDVPFESDDTQFNMQRKKFKYKKGVIMKHI